MVQNLLNLWNRSRWLIHFTGLMFNMGHGKAEHWIGWLSTTTDDQYRCFPVLGPNLCTD